MRLSCTGLQTHHQKGSLLAGLSFLPLPCCLSGHLNNVTANWMRWRKDVGDGGESSMKFQVLTPWVQNALEDALGLLMLLSVCVSKAVVLHPSTWPLGYRERATQTLPMQFLK